jgi:SAM-dependent methyltransferase
MTPEQDQNNREVFERIARENRLLFPDDQLVRLLARLERAPAAAERRAIDVGCGGGRHTLLLHQFGFDAWGLDYSEEIVRACQRDFAGGPLADRFIAGRLCDLSAEHGPFAVIVFWGVAFCGDHASMVFELTEARRRLAPDGLLLANFRTIDNWFHGLGKLCGPGSFRLDERAREYAGITYLFLDEPALRDAVASAGLELRLLEREDYWKGPERLRHSWWLKALAPSS